MKMNLRKSNNFFRKLSVLLIVFCLSITVEANQSLDSNIKSEKCNSESGSEICMESGMKTTFRVEASVSVVSQNSTILNLVSPLNRCVEKECKYCCLSINRCGTKKQCHNSKKTMKIFKTIFIILILFCLIILGVKIYQNSSLPEQMTNERVDVKIINELLELYGIIRTNRKNIIVS